MSEFGVIPNPGITLAVGSLGRRVPALPVVHQPPAGHGRRLSSQHESGSGPTTLEHPCGHDDTRPRRPRGNWLAATIQFLDDGRESAAKHIARAVKEFAAKLSFRLAPVPGRRSPAANRPPVYTHDDGVVSPFVEASFRLNGILRLRGWWPTVRTDTGGTARTCRNCQIAQGARKSLEREAAQHMVTPGLRPFERWGIDLGAFNELISDNGSNLLSGAVRHFVNLIIEGAVMGVHVLIEELRKNLFCGVRDCACHWPAGRYLTPGCKADVEPHSEGSFSLVDALDFWIK
ncbi:hypothetical protein N7461_006628 [Penicillium sp. DV-2018c]|nr:hypothetical protein N7461_006628 [Penicillium sp. DV-2018c]